MDASSIQILDTLEESVNHYANAFDPCPMCDDNRYEKTADGQERICTHCCYYFASQFKAKKE